MLQKMEMGIEVSLKEAQKLEALLRMKKIGLMPRIIEEFKKENKINKSLSSKIGKALMGKLVWLSDEEINMVKEFEEEHNCIVYHIIESHTTVGTLLSLFYVSKYTDEWEMDNELIDSKCQFVYVKNLDCDYDSEFGYINYTNAVGGLIRTA